MANPQHRTLSANTELVLTLDEDYAFVQVVNVNGGAAIYFTFGAASTPGVETDGSDVVPAAIGAVTVRPATTGATVIKLKAVTGVKVAVRGLSER